MASAAISRLPNQKTSYIQEELTEKCGSILLGYRKNCATATAASQVCLTISYESGIMMVSLVSHTRSVSSVANVYACNDEEQATQRFKCSRIYQNTS